MIQIEYISHFLNNYGVEGPQQLTGYIPARPGNFIGGRGYNPAKYTAIGASGVTCATGADLGQTNAKTMLGYGVSQTTVDALSFYYGKKRGDAINALSELPLRLSQPQADEIDHHLHAGYAKLVEARYNKESDNAYSNLPEQAQAVIFSMLYQMGCTGGPRTGENTWKALLRGDWKDASTRLCTKKLWSAYQLRRGMEGQLLKELL